MRPDLRTFLVRSDVTTFANLLKLVVEFPLSVIQEYAGLMQ